MARVMSPGSTDKENEGAEEAVAFFTASSRAGLSRRLVISLADQRCAILRQNGEGDKARGFEQASLNIAMTRQ